MPIRNFPFAPAWIVATAVLAMAAPSPAWAQQQQEEGSPPAEDDVLDRDVPDDPDCEPPYAIIETGGAGTVGGGSAITFDWKGPAGWVSASMTMAA
jgi:hypothetical protein